MGLRFRTQGVVICRYMPENGVNINMFVGVTEKG
jgi:hypothetical protein